MNISADSIVLSNDTETLMLERNGVDRELGPVLVAQDEKLPFSKILVINGPGGFTNLRVGTLALNLLKVLKKNQITFFTISKIELYTFFYKKGWITRYIALYIGQKTNIWLWDLQENKLISTIKKTDIGSLQQEYGEITLDQVYQDGYFETVDTQISYDCNPQKGVLYYKTNEYRFSREDLHPLEVEKLEPNYMIQPNVN